MDCERARELLLLAASDDLEPHEAAEVEAHGAACPECREAGERFRSIFGAFAGLAEPAPVPEPVRDELWDGIRDRLRSEGFIRPPIPRPRPWLHLVRPLGGGLLAAGVLVGAFLVGWFADPEPEAGNGSASRPASPDVRPVADPPAPHPSTGPATSVAGRPPTRFDLSNGRSDRRGHGEENYLETVYFERRAPRRAVEYELPAAETPAIQVSNVDF